MRNDLLGSWPHWKASLDRAVKLEKDDKMALELARSVKVVPERVLQQANLQVATQLSSEETVNRYRTEAAHQLAEITLERHAIYGSSLPMEEEESRKLVEKSLGEEIPDDFLEEKTNIRD